MIKLYDYELSGNCYKVRLILAFLKITYYTELVEFYPSKQHKESNFLKINPLGQLPVIDDGGHIIRDAQAILIYIALKYQRNNLWYPKTDIQKISDLQQWLSFANELTNTSSAARLHDGFFYTNIDVKNCRDNAHKLFRILDEHLYFCELEKKKWICSTNHPTIADIACFPYVILSEEGGISRMNYPAIRRWCDRFKRIPGFEVMSGVFRAGPEENNQLNS
jgi:glutathione S-transferase